MKHSIFQSRNSLWVYIILFVSILAGCHNSKPTKQTDTFSAGKIKLGIDDSYRLMMEAQLDVYTTIYNRTSFDTIFNDETSIINLFLTDSIPAMVISRPLSKEQTDALLSQRYVARSTIIGRDAIALILNKENKTNELLYDQVRDIFAGKISKWKQINPSSNLGDINVVFDKQGSSNIHYFMDKFNLKEFPSNFGATNSNNDIITYIESHKNAIGILSVNWISDKQDSVSNNFLSWKLI